jgi:flagellar biosynthesis/type III secretory pathway M-ring protein FliF/YscJ
MSQSAGAAGVYGILLNDLDSAEVELIVKKLDAAQLDYTMENEWDELENGPEDVEAIKLLRAELDAYFIGKGVVIPEKAKIHWTAFDDERPASCATDGEQWVLGFGLFTLPSEYPQLDKTFTDLSAWYTWAWMG